MDVGSNARTLHLGRPSQLAQLRPCLAHGRRECQSTTAVCRSHARATGSEQSHPTANAAAPHAPDAPAHPPRASTATAHQYPCAGSRAWCGGLVARALGLVLGANQAPEIVCELERLDPDPYAIEEMHEAAA